MLDEVTVLKSGIISILGIVGVMALTEQFDKLLSKKFVTVDACKDCRSRCANVVNAELRTIRDNQSKQGLLLTMIANQLGIKGIKDVEIEG